MIEANGVFVSGSLEEVSLSVKKGEIVCVLGTNGSGKTALCDVLAGVREPDKGEVSILPGGYMTAGTSLVADMTVRANLKFTCDLEGFSHTQADDKIRAASAATGIDAYLDKTVETLPAAVRKCATLANALLTGGDNLILDEPTFGLESGDCLRLRRAVASLKEEKAVLIASRSLTEAMRLADRILLLDKGRIVAECDPDRLDELAKDPHRVAVRFAGDPQDALAAGAESAEEAGGTVRAVFPCEDAASLLKALMAKGLPVCEFAPARLDVDALLGRMDTDDFSEGAE